MQSDIEKFENTAEKFRSAGGILEEKEELEQFRTSLPSSFNEVRSWFSLLPFEDKTYTNLKVKAIETAEFTKRDD